MNNILESLVGIQNKVDKLTERVKGILNNNDNTK